MAEEKSREYENGSAADLNKDEKSLKEIICDITEQELSGSSDDIVTVEQLKSMEKECSSRLKRRRLIGAAAVFFVAIAGALIVSVNYPADVEADKNAPEEIVSEDGVVIEDGGWGSSSEDTLVITDWDEVKLLKAEMKDILLPQYIPDSFYFEKLTIEILDGNDKLCVYQYKGVKQTLELHQYISEYDSSSFEINKKSDIISASNGVVYIQEGSHATIQMNNGMIIDIWGYPNKKELIKIVDNMYF